MSQDKLPKELQFRKGDIVRMVQLKSKKKWNGKHATILGPFSRSKQRWPIQINFGPRTEALLQPKNLRIEQRGTGWVIDTKSPVQRLNLLLKCYTRDLEAFSKLTRREKKIFDDKFQYEMHDDIRCRGLSEFDHQLNVMKSTIIKLAEQQQESVEKFLIDDTQVMALDDGLLRFHVIVAIKIGNDQIWKRTALVELDADSKLVRFGKLLSMEICDDPKAKGSPQGDDQRIKLKVPSDQKQDDDTKDALNNLNAVKHGQNAKHSQNEANDTSDSK